MAAAVATSVLSVPVASVGAAAPAGPTASVHRTQRSAALEPHVVGGSSRRLSLLDSRPHRTSSFDMVGATWRRSNPPRGGVEVRIRQGRSWSHWHLLALDDAGPNAGSADARTAARDDAVTTTPLWVGPGGDAVAVRVVGPSGNVRRTPHSLHVLLVDGGRSAADSETSVAHLRTTTAARTSGSSRPVIYTRSDWGADERIRRHATGKGCGHPKYGSSVKVAFIHHTDTSNGYSRRAVPAIIRSMYRYHVFGHGWCDIGYNFLVDRFGRIWQGRYGGMAKPVIGAQSGGFNVNSLGVAMIGTFNSVSPNHAMRRALVRLLVWRLGAEFRDPLGREKLHADRFYESRYRAGRRISFRVIAGHRNADYTDCPGSRGYRALPGIRRAVMAHLNSGLVDPTLQGQRAWRFGSSGAPVVLARALKAESWRLQVIDAAGAVIHSAAGSAPRGGRIVAGWNGTSGFGTPVLPGRYLMVLTPSRGGRLGVPFRTTVTIAPEVTISGPAIAGYGSPVKLHGSALPHAAVTVTISARPTRTVTAAANGQWSTTYIAAVTSAWRATSGSGTTAFTTPAGTTTVVPMVTSPAPVNGVIRPLADSFTLLGTAVPLSFSVSVMANGTELAGAAVDGSGHWSAPLTVNQRTAITVVASGGATSPTYTVVPPNG
jgi:hypothetical protein